MYVHSVKVPRLYKDAAKILQEVKENGGSIKKLVFGSKHCNKKGLCALVTQTLRRFSAINTLIEKANLLTNESRLNPWLARILITEILWGKKQLPDKSTPLKTIITYKEKLEKLESEVNCDPIEITKTIKVNKPRVVRVNTNITSVENVITEFKNENWQLVPFTGKSYEEFVAQTSALQKNEFMVDLHFKELLHFPFQTEFHHHRAYKNGTLVLQDKASCLPSRLLNPEPGSVILDMCAAPGMKTTHLAALLNNNGKIYAVERDSNRFKVLKTMIKKFRATCVRPINKDVLKLTSQHCPDVKYILVDPSCSGSGITDRLEFTKAPKPKDHRLKKLAGFQIKVLKHALKHFPQAERVVYSTCSINSKENEYVINEVLKNDIDFKLVNAQELLKGTWKSNSTRKWPGITENCLCMKPEKDLTNGFFIAVFERSESNKQPKTETDLANNNTDVTSKEKRELHKHENEDNLKDKLNTVDSAVGNECSTKKKKKRKRNAGDADISVLGKSPELKKRKQSVG